MQGGKNLQNNMMECFRIVDEQRPRLSNNEHCSSFINPK